MDGGPEGDAGLLTEDGGAPDAASMPIEDAGAMDAAAVSDGGGPDAGPFESTSFMHTFPAMDFVCPPGASPPCDTTVPRQSTAERTVTVTREFAPTSVAYVLSELRIPVPRSSLTIVGFNLDNRDSGRGLAAPSATCEEFATDFRGIYDVASRLRGDLTMSASSRAQGTTSVNDLVAQAVAIMPDSIFRE